MERGDAPPYIASLALAFVFLPGTLFEDSLPLLRIFRDCRCGATCWRDALVVPIPLSLWSYTAICGVRIQQSLSTRFILCVYTRQLKKKALKELGLGLAATRIAGCASTRHWRRRRRWSPQRADGGRLVLLAPRAASLPAPVSRTTLAEFSCRARPRGPAGSADGASRRERLPLL